MLQRTPVAGWLPLFAAHELKALKRTLRVSNRLTG
ncbi:hypothetical protein BN873_100005 [Candidatus Competibacter denitrificans Run_A_D11]|uniref:Uncharacterized protein n=1 Tax=Candidatus Competibacter denitrificans Run_A_D11 TaxID=1400863 RepID=W6MAZ2_9GAMM|nr:hypothetical protein BN873_100005 [Candidatus Competibacter denitrificans Run_A_D11]